MLNSNFSLMLLLKGVLNKIPFFIIQAFLNYSLRKMHRKYPRVFSKISEQEIFSYLIVPTDLPFNFYLIIDKEQPILTVEKKDADIKASATIKATLNNLLEMFQGKLDGDAAFFSKSLIIEGSTVAIVTLRNSLDSENINLLEDFTENFGIFKPILIKLIVFSNGKFNNINYSLQEIQEQLLQDCNNKIKYNVNEINLLKEEIAKIRSRLSNS